jgi:hypothetical protein
MSLWKSGRIGDMESSIKAVKVKIAFFDPLISFVHVGPVLIVCLVFLGVYCEWIFKQNVLTESYCLVCIKQQYNHLEYEKEYIKGIAWEKTIIDWNKTWCVTAHGLLIGKYSIKNWVLHAF